MNTPIRLAWVGFASCVLAAIAPACSGQQQSAAVHQRTGTGSRVSPTPGGAAAASNKAEGSSLTDGAPVAFRKQFDQPDLGFAWNLFGVAAGKREVRPGPDGLYIYVLAGERAWDAVGARTSRIVVQGDFDLRGRFRSFSSGGNGAAKLIVVDAATTSGEAAYVERIQIDGKNLFKFGGEVGENLEDWGYVPTESPSGDLRLLRKGGKIQGFFRTADHGPWQEVGPAQTVPKSMPNTLKFGVKLSGDLHKSAQVTWTELAMEGQVIRTE